MLLFLFTIFLFLGASTQIGTSSSKKSSQKTIPPKQASDKLLEWMTFMKNESQRYRDQDELSKAVEILSRCIDKRWREPVTPEEHEKLAWIYTNRAYLFHERMGDFLSAKDDYLSALEQFESCESSSYLVARYVYQPLGNIYTRLGENEIAISMLEKFKRACEQSGETEALMNAYNDIGRAYLNSGELEEAIKWFSEGIEIDDSDYFNLGLLYSSKSEAEEIIGEFKKSTSSTEKSLQYLNQFIQRTDTSDYHYITAKEYKISALRIRAKLFIQSSDFLESQKVYSEAIQLARAVYPDNHREIARLLVEYGIAVDASGEPLKALKFCQLGLATMIDGLDSSDWSSNPRFSELFADVVLGEALHQKGISTHALFKKTGNSNWLKISVDTYSSYFDWVEIQRSEQFEFKSKLGTAKQVHLIGESALAAYFDLYNQTKDRNWIDSAFVLMDQTKGIVLAEERGFRKLATKNRDLSELLNETNALKYQRSQFVEDLQEAMLQNNKENKSRIKKRLSELDEQSQLLERKIRKLSPSYRTGISSKLSSRIQLKFAEKLEKRNADVLSFFVGEHEMYAIVGRPGNFDFYTIDRTEFDQGMNNFLSELILPQNSTPRSYANAGNKLFQLLFRSRIIGSTTNWVILPDATLNSLPFEALIESKGSLSSFKSLNYLVRKHGIQYAPSAFLFTAENGSSEELKPFIGIAPTFKDSKTYSYLPKSLDEIQVGLELFDGTALSGKEASKKNFLSESVTCDILHISTHAGKNTGENNDAWMAFSDKRSSDHKLVANELLKLDIPASLVVLNACETGTGTIFKGEGPMSLARSFLDAGAESTLTNLWSVNHESNALIMERFYTHLSETQSPSTSLNKAKLDYLSNGEIDDASAHPYYWSSAILVGTDASVIAPSSSSLMTWLLIGMGSMVIAVLAIVLFRRHRRTKRVA